MAAGQGSRDAGKQRSPAGAAPARQPQARPQSRPPPRPAPGPAPRWMSTMAPLTAAGSLASGEQASRGCATTSGYRRPPATSPATLPPKLACMTLRGGRGAVLRGRRRRGRRWAAVGGWEPRKLPRSEAAPWALVARSSSGRGAKRGMAAAHRRPPSAAAPSAAARSLEGGGVGALCQGGVPHHVARGGLHALVGGLQ